MKIHLKANFANGIHTRFNVYVNGAYCGTLTMRDEEASSFHQIVSHGCCNLVDEFLSSGEWGLSDSDDEHQSYEDNIR